MGKADGRGVSLGPMVLCYEHPVGASGMLEVSVICRIHHC